jgi:hypothetical protein
MAVREKRLFWMSLIVVELVLLYVVWRPYRDRFIRPPHRIALAPPVVRPPEIKPTPIIIAPRKPLKVTRSNGASPGRPPTFERKLEVARADSCEAGAGATNPLESAGKFLVSHGDDGVKLRL